MGKKKGKKGRKGEDRKSRGRGKKGDLPAQPPSNRLGQTVRDKQDAKNLSFFFSSSSGLGFKVKNLSLFVGEKLE